jgi:hypothetical protein
MKHPLRFLFAVLMLATLACSFAGRATTPPPTDEGALPSQPSPAAASPTPPPGAKAPVFASYNKPEVALPDSFSGYDLPLDLATVQGIEGFDLSAEQENLLSKNGFVVAAPGPDGVQEFYQIYEGARYQDRPIFVTSDSVLHVYHLLFDKILRDLETGRFIATLETLAGTMLEAMQAQYDSLKGTNLEEQARRNVAFFSVLTQLLEMDVAIPPEVQDLVEAELANIEEHAGPAISPIWDREDLPPDKQLIEDYTQYIPRGHYTRSDDLKRYFRSMMYCGRMTYRLRDTFETQRALLVTRALTTAVAPDGTPAVTLWQTLYEPTVFLVGKSDDLSYFEYAPLSDSVFGAGASLESFGDPAKIAEFLEAAEQLPPPQVNSMWVWIWEDKTDATKGFRFMGQRFTIDAYVFGQLIWREVGTESDPRNLPKALDFFAALGSEEAYALLESMGETEYANYDSQMGKVRTELDALQSDTWTENVYWSWLYALQPIIEVKDGRFPEFMRTQAWTRKDLNTALGSYTELKHDTILYAKQVMAEMGGAGPEEIPHGYVEPNPEAFARLQALAEMTRDGLEARGLLSDRMRGNLANLIDLLRFLKTSAEKELNREALSEDDYMRIRFVGGELEALTLAAADCEDEEGPACRNLQDQKAALVADIATGPGLTGLVVLEEAIGRPTSIYVVLPDQPLRLSEGAVFTYYEFVLPAAERMTDETWQAKVDAGDTPPLPDWTQAFMAP